MMGNAGEYMNNKNDVLDMFGELFEISFGNSNLTNGVKTVFRTPAAYLDSYPASQFPPVNVEIDEETKDLFFTFALAGYSGDEIKLEFEGDYMELSSEIIAKEKDKKLFIKKGIKKSSFSCKYPVLMSKYDTEKAEASFRDGLLKVMVPAREGMKPKQVKIES